ncbi:MAG: hypothetical protein JOZ96_16490 [Acidobacteria bacterium]|nr:hypothetical protein [Acidobacteriota bacterium]
MSFDHDAGRYVKFGTGHVSADVWVQGTRCVMLESAAAIDTSPSLNFRGTFAMPPGSTAFSTRAYSQTQTTTQVKVTFQDDGGKPCRGKPAQKRQHSGHRGKRPEGFELAHRPETADSRDVSGALTARAHPG